MVKALKLQSLYSFELKPKNPFNFYLTASCYNFNWWFNGSKCLIPISKDPPLIAVAHQPHDKVVVDIYGEKSVDHINVEEFVQWALGLNEDLTGFYNVIEDDAILREVPRSLQGMRMRATGFWNALLIAICQQNTSFIQGWSMLCRIYKLFGMKVKLNGIKSILPLSPRDFLTSEAEAKLREAKVGYRAKTIMHAASMIEKGYFEHLERLKDEEAEEKLKEIKGVGSYTARLTLVLSQRRYSLLPLDRWLKRLAEEIYKLKNVEEELKARWKEWCGLAVFFTTVVLDAEVLSKALRRALNGDVKPSCQYEKLSPLTLWMHAIC